MKILIITFILYLFSLFTLGDNIKHSDHLVSYDGLGHESVFDIYKDKDGLLWLSTNKGVRCYNGHAVTKYNCNEETGFVYTIRPIGNSRLVACTSNGLFEINREQQNLQRIYKEINNAKCIYNNMAGGSHGLWKLDANGKCHNIPLESSVISPANAVTDIRNDRNGGAWISTNKRIIRR
ncbi:MAG: hypothetical protein K6E54_10370, partial [Bacteroidaceae bacterium]|nr:hypothetical protein [Bacteroidaceae bacterium]